MFIYYRYHVFISNRTPYSAILYITSARLSALAMTVHIVFGARFELAHEVVYNYYFTYLILLLLYVLGSGCCYCYWCVDCLIVASSSYLLFAYRLAGVVFFSKCF